MSKSVKDLAVSSIICLFLTGVPVANAAIDVFASTFATSTKVTGNCFFGLDDNEPFSAINSDCELVEYATSGEIRLDYEPISGFSLGWPRNGYESFDDWDMEYLQAPKSETFYCTIMGLRDNAGDEPVVILGHFEDPNYCFDPETSDECVVEGKSKCRYVEQQIQAYFQTFCFGGYVIVFGLNEIDSDVHRSYRYLSQPILCWDVAVEGSH